MPEVLDHTTINVGQRLPDVPTIFYRNTFRLLEELRMLSSAPVPDNYDAIKYGITNYLYFIHERFNKEVVRDIDYSNIQNFVTKNKDLMLYLFDKQFSNEYPDSGEALRTWIDQPIDILDCGMYKPSNRYNKHIFH